ncbi:hypothetical protein HanXRQr2_Chr17g0782271 [Helianthus annuus]|uniref:Uncharacterized protein n=1 Tax=Helianthus annuus TaxID=4232 RepID=A0A9K3DDU3_HELAN|nr:hypothetical protein HanXRQr2_Chr17g0782271 [Helianthus annuus]
MLKMTMLMVTTAAGRRRSCTGDDCSRGSGSLQILSGFWLGFGSRSKLVSRGSGVVRVSVKAGQPRFGCGFGSRSKLVSLHRRSTAVNHGQNQTW